MGWQSLSCVTCGTPFRARGAHVRSGRAKCCSRACAYELRSRAAATPERIRARFASYIDTNGPIPAHRPELGPCHIWTATRMKSGYPQFYFEGRRRLAHRVAFFLAHGRWPDPCALHKCDGGPLGCVRDDHLFEGTKKDNTQDMLAKGRCVVPDRRGARNGRARLTPQQVLLIREAVAQGAGTQAEIGAQFGVEQITISNIVTGRTWQHVR